MHGEPLLTIRELRGHLAVILIGGKGPRDLEDPDGLGRSSGRELLKLIGKLGEGAL